MLDFEVERCKRRCSVTGRDLAPGEAYYSALLPQGSLVARLDYSAEAWAGPPEGAVGWWQARLPEAHGGKPHWAPNDVLLNYFEQLQDLPEQADTRYVLALLLVRRRIVRLEETQTGPGGRETLVLFCPRNEAQYHVEVAMPSDERASQIQNDLARLLCTESGG
jgi:hypothetical protein